MAKGDSEGSHRSLKDQNSSGLVRKQLNMPKKTLHKILAHEKRNPGGTRKKEEL
jgi:hypothetical protein